jgi:hypothetical protein
MEEEDRGLIFGDVRYTIISSDEKTRLVRKRMLHTHIYSLAYYVVVAG